MDAVFDPDATLTELEAGADEERIRADWAENDPHVPAKWAAVEAKLGGNLGDEDKREIAYATGGECSDGADTHRGVGNRAAR